MEETKVPVPHIKDPSLQAFAKQIAGWLDDKKAENLRIYDVRTLCSYADYVIIASGSSDRHVFAMADSIRENGKIHGHYALGVEGLPQAQWVLIDYGDIVIHLFSEPVRDYYELDRLWGSAPRLPFASSPSLALPGNDGQDGDEDDEDGPSDDFDA